MNKFAAFLTLVIAVSGSAFATPLTPGQTVIPSTTTAAAFGSLVITTSGTATSNTAGNGNFFVADYTESVYIGGTGALCPTCLNFVLQFSNTSPNDTINRAVLGSFTGYLTDAAFVDAGIPALFVPPSSASRSADGSLVTFSMTGGLQDGQFSDALVVFTNATGYQAGTLSFQSDVTANAVGFQPVPVAAAVPEPGSLALLGTGIAGLAGLVRRKIAG